MKITVFTGNQPRHLSLIEDLSLISDEVFAIQECNTVFPGKVNDFYKKSDVMQRYFSKVIDAETLVFGKPRFLPFNVRTLSLKHNDLKMINMNVLRHALKSDFYIVFGSSFIKGELAEFLVKHKAINIHMGLSPYYRGSGSNFWALYDRRPDFVGATIHLLSEGLDSGEVLFHALPKVEEVDPFILGMLSVKSAHDGLMRSISTGEILKMNTYIQDKKDEIRCTRNKDFTDKVVLAYMKEVPTQYEILKLLKKRDLSILINPHVL